MSEALATPRNAAPDVVERCRRGEEAAFRELYRTYSRQVAAQLSGLVARSDLEDVLQEVFVEVFRSIRRFEGRSAFTTWLYRVALNVAMKHRRKAARAPVAVGEDLPDTADPNADPSGAAFSAERARRVEKILDQLAPKKRMVLVMHDLQGIDATEIAARVGSNVLTVRTRLFYARRELSKLAAEDPALQEWFGGPKGAEGEGGDE